MSDQQPPADNGGDEHNPSDPDRADAADDDPQTHDDRDLTIVARAPNRRSWRTRALAFGFLPFIAVLLTLAAAYFKYLDSKVHESDRAAAESEHGARGCHGGTKPRQSQTS